MSLADAITDLESGQSNEDMLTAIKARTITKYGMASGADISGVLLSVGLLSLIEDQKNATGEHTPLRNMCIALEKRFSPDGQVDLSNPSNVAVVDAFLAEATVAGILSAQSIDPNTVKETLMALGRSEVPEFPDVRMADIVNIRGAE